MIYLKLRYYGKEYKGTDNHAFVKACKQQGIGQKFTKVNRSQTNGKAERVILTLMEMWHIQHTFKDNQDRHLQLDRFINFGSRLADVIC